MPSSDPSLDTLVIADSPAGARFNVRVFPRSPREGVDGVRDGRLVVRLTAAPVDGAANAAAVLTLSRLLDVPRSAVRLVAGHMSRNKVVNVSGLSAADVRQRIGGRAIARRRAGGSSGSRPAGPPASRPDRLKNR